MEILDFLMEKRRMEKALTLTVEAEFKKFKAKTGFSPSSLSVNMITVFELGDKAPTYMVDRVKVNVPIE